MDNYSRENLFEQEFVYLIRLNNNNNNEQIPDPMTLNNEPTTQFSDIPMQDANTAYLANNDFGDILT